MDPFSQFLVLKLIFFFERCRHCVSIHLYLVCSQKGIFGKSGPLFVFEHFCWNCDFAKTLKKPWYSGLAQGQGLSVLIRAYYETKNEIYLNASKKVYKSFFQNVNQGGVTAIDSNNRRKFTFELPGSVAGLGLQNNQTYTTANGLSTNAFVQAEVDSVESASPYMFNLSILD